jgi:lactoylglutathione lyase
MPTSRDHLHRLVDALPEEALGFAETTLQECQARSSDRSLRGAAAQIDHLGAWVTDLQRACAFYERWFQAKPGPMYSSTRRKFESSFLTLGRGPRLEFMASPGESARSAHVALSLGSRKAVDHLCEQMSAEGVPIAGEPRQTGDGYYEAVVMDSEGNLIEITV